MVSATALLVAGPAYADFVGSVRAQLRAQGYRQISVTDTLLGRSRIVAKGKGGTREIIMNPRTGEILRDLWLSADGTPGPSIGGSEGTSDDSGDDDNGDDSGEDSDSSGEGSEGESDGGESDGGEKESGDD